MNKSKRSVLFFATNDYLALYAARILDQRKYRSYFLGLGNHAIRFSGFCAGYYECERTEDGLIRQIQDISNRHAIDAVIPLDLSATVCLSRIKRGIDIPVMPLSGPDIMVQLSDKWESTFLFDAAGVRTPETVLITHPENLQLNIFSLPFLVKPLRQGASRGIYKISTNQDIYNIVHSYSPYVAFPMIAQQYIDGEDIDLSFISRDGIILGYTIQQWKTGGYLELIDDPEVLLIGKKLASYVKYSGFMHVDMRREHKTGRLYVLECNPRSWGTIGASIGAGMDFIGLAIASAANGKVRAMSPHKMTYMTPLTLLKKSVRKPRVFREASEVSKRDFVGMFSDPLPYLILAVAACIERVLLAVAWIPFVRPRLVKRVNVSYFQPIIRYNHPSGIFP